jgi:hypothetical protein
VRRNPHPTSGIIGEELFCANKKTGSIFALGLLDLFGFGLFVQMHEEVVFRSFGKHRQEAEQSEQTYQNRNDNHDNH